MSDSAVLKRRVICDIKSIVVVYAKDGVNIKQLNKEYRIQNGRDIPYMDLGKTSLENLLRSIPEEVRLVTKPELRVFPIVDEKIAHIVHLVNKTVSKKDDKSNQGGRNEFHRETREKLPAIKKGSVPAASREQIESALRAAGASGVAIDDFQTNFSRFNGIILNYQFFGFQSLVECLKSIPNVVTLIEYDTGNTYCVSTSTLEKVNALNQKENQTFLPSLPLQKTQPQMAKEHSSSETPKSASNNQEPNVEGAKLSNYYEVQIPEIEDDIHKNIKREIQMVLEYHSKGLYVDDFSDAFEELHEKPLDLEALGYFNIMELVYKFPDIFGLIRLDNSKGKVIIYDARKPLSMIQDDNKKVHIPEDIIKRIEQILETNQFGISLTRLEQLYNLNCKTNLPYISLGFLSIENFIHELMSFIPFQLYEENGMKRIRLRQEHLISDNLVLDRVSPEPNDTLQIREAKIPADAVTDADANLFYSERLDERKNLDKYFKIIISQVHTPGFFWFQIDGYNTTKALGLLMDELENAYNLPRGQDYMIPHKYFLLNMPCVALYEGDWHRAQIIGFPSNELVEVFYVDYGTKDTVTRNDVRFIKERFISLPNQAIKAKLAFLEPVSNSNEWSSAAGTRLLELTKHKIILCKVLTPLDYKKGLKVVLCEQREEGVDVYINDILVNEGFAKPVEEEAFELECNENFYEEQIEMPFCQPSVPATPPGVTPLNFSPEPEQLEPKKPTKAPPGFSPCSSNPTLMKLAAKLQALKKQNYDSFDLQSPSPPSIPSSVPNDSFYQSKIPFRGPPMTLLQTTTVVPNPIYASPKRVESLMSNPNVLTNATPEKVPMPDKIESQNSPPPTSKSANYRSEGITSSALPSQARYTKMEKFTEMYEGHVINYDSRLYLATGDISYFIYRADVLVKLLKHLKLDKEIEMKTIEEEQCPSLFQELRKSGVRGFTKIDKEKSSITLLPLESCIKALKKIPPVRQDLEESIQKVLDNFDPEDCYWNEKQDDDPNETEEFIREQLRKLEMERRIITKRMAEQEGFDSYMHLTYTQIMKQYSQYVDLDLSNANESVKKAFQESSIQTNSGSQTINEQQQSTQKSVQAVAPITMNQTQVQVRTALPTNTYIGPSFMTNQPNPQFIFQNMMPQPSVLCPNVQYMPQFLLPPIYNAYQRPPPRFGANNTHANNIYYNMNNNR